MSDIGVKSYRYLRIAMVGLLIGLGIAVFYQSAQQGFLLKSVSAYYYTPAQAMFVGGLIALGTCMIALRGTSDLEDILLNLGGMLAIVVAVVPTAISADYRSAVRACREGTQVPADVDCPTVQALAAATKANVETNMLALLIVGGLGLLITLVFALRDRRRNPRKKFVRGFWWGLGAAFAIWAAVGALVLTDVELVITYAHYGAAIGLVVSIFFVAVANAVRREREQTGDARAVLLRSPRRLSRYAWLAWVMVIGIAVGAVLWGTHVITLFWLEIGAAFLFAVFWAVQTYEQMDDDLPADAR